ncbi:hypothetical protein [Comamonas sp. JC664]|uniref:hypothetical protein n=1 Tax=Comamonas sp. JC664 TaxID=2801917 RepID=UPI00191E82AD|nr:hypothetical protein [Comamonas sp. JC664]MBL0694702.1 hypothetical protein [Comamonas sp. JC664]
MSERSRAVVEAELAHVQFLLGELPRWELSDVPLNARRFIFQRYERQARILLAVLTELPQDGSVQVAGTAPDEVPAAHESRSTPQEAEAAEVSTGAVMATQSEDPAAAAAQAESPSTSPEAPAWSEAPSSSSESARHDVPSHGFEPTPAPPAEASARAAEPETEETGAERHDALLPLPPNPAEPYSEPPQPRSLTARLVEETSTWNRVWRPFLYESIMWFVGAFLILSGTLYFVFESWAGMSSSVRSLTVFGMTAGYSAGFAIWGAFLARREALRKPGHILGLIGAAVAPLAGIALGPLGLGDLFQLGGVGTGLLVPSLVVWSGVAAFLARKPLDAIDAPSRPFIQLALVASTWMMGLAPLAARWGEHALWLDVLPCALYFLLASRPTPTPREDTSLAFVIAAPLYLLLLYFARLHVALAGAEVEVSAGAYAPFCAFLLATALRFRTLDPERGTDALAMGAVSLQAACLIAASVAAPPTFFVTAAVMSWTLVSLARGGLARVRWASAAYATLYFTYASCSQLFPGLALRWMNGVKVRFGYAVTEPLPLQFGALSALPFIFAGAVLAVSRLWRGERVGSARDTALAEVLLRTTAVASVLFVFLSITGPDARPAFWSALALAVLCLTLGLLVERFFLTVVGAGLCLFLPFQALAVLEASRGSVAVGALALVLAAVAQVCTARTRQLLGVIVGVVSLVGFLMGLTLGTGLTAVTGMALCAAAAVLVAWMFQSAALMALAAVLAAAVVPSLAGQLASKSVAPALAATALGLALVGLRGGVARWLGLPAVFYALLAVPWGMLDRVPGLGVVILVAAGAVAVASRAIPWVRFIAVGLASLALIRDLPGVYTPWGGWMSPELSVVLFCCWALGASVIAARGGRNINTTVAALIALVLPPTALLGSASVGHTPLLLGAALAALLTARALPATVSVVVAAFYAVCALSASGGVALLGLAAVLSLLAVLEEVPSVARVGAGGERFALAASLCAAGVLGMAVVKWDDAPLPLLLAGTGALPLLWTRATRLPFLAALVVPYSFVGIVVVGGALPGWVQALPLLALVLVRAVAHVPVVASLLLRSREEAPRNALSLWMQGWLAAVTVAMVVLALSSAVDRTPLYVLTASVALMPGPLPFIRVCGAALALLPFPVARSVAMALLLAVAIAESHWPARVWAFFRSGRDAALRLASVATALVMAVLTVMDAPTPANLGVLAGVLALSAFLLSHRWLLAPAVWVLALALAPMGAVGLEDLLFRRDGDGLSSFIVALGAAALAAVCQVGAIQRGLTRAFAKVLPPLEDTWSEPLWVGGAGALGALLVQRVLTSWTGSLSLPAALVGVATACLLMVARERWMANVATGLLGMTLVAAVDPLWLPAILGGVGLALCLLGMWLDTREVRVGASLHHGGWGLSLLSLTAIRELGHVGMPLSLLFAVGATWAVVYRRRERELLGWLASLVAVHGVLIHLGVVFSSGRGAAFLLPYFGAGSALLAALALFVASPTQRKAVGFGFTVVALLEVVTGLALVDASLGALREGLVASVSLGVLLIALVRRAAVEKDAAFAYLAQGVLALGYLSVRMLGMGATLVAGDSLAALVGGALFTGLYFFVQREGSTLACFRGPAVLGAYLFPLAGLLSAPWRDPLDAAALLVGHAAHFAALASHPARRGLASLVSVVAFNVALLLVWQWTGSGEAQFYVIPAGLSLLALLRVFRGSIDADTYARLRALAVTVIYVAGAWKPLMFSDGSAMLLCVFLCVVGVAFGIALRIRSYVYLGTGFLVTCIAANLVRFGMRDHRIAAASLFILGLMVIGSMVMLSAHRATLLHRYARVRELLATWEG